MAARGPRARAKQEFGCSSRPASSDNVLGFVIERTNGMRRAALHRPSDCGWPASNCVYNYEEALAQAPLDHRRALIMTTSPVFYRDHQRLAELALRHRMASMFVLREWVDAGGLLSYGASFPAMFRRAADYADKIAKGAKAADLPIEQPTKFELVVNLKTARAIGVEIPTSKLLRADEVIE